MLIRLVLLASFLGAGVAFAETAPAPSDKPAGAAATEQPASPASEGGEAAAIDPLETLAKTLAPQDEAQDLPGRQTHIVPGDEFAYLSPADAEKLLVQIWGNPPATAQHVLGAIVPKGVSVLSENAWAAIITYSNEGHIADDDAESINYDDLLKEMQTATVENNDERVKAGYQPLILVGWAQKPSYDKAQHKLYWAKDIQFGNDAHTLNYAIRVLGRTGVLEVNVIAGMSQLQDINAKLPKLLSTVTFNEGHRYADFDEKTDDVAAYGIAALVAGGIAAKAGLLKGLLTFLAASWKLIAVGVAAFGSFVWRIFKGKPNTTS